MRRHLFYLALAAVVVLTAGASSTFAARGSGNILYLFNGRLLADAGSSPALYVDVNGGNHAALRKLIGHGDDQQFAVDSNTQYIRWTNGVPTVVQESNLAAGDRVTVRVRAARDASLAQIEATAAANVADRGPNGRFPHKPLWLFVGKLDGPAANHQITLHIANGNLRALRAMLGQPLAESAAGRRPDLGPDPRSRTGLPLAGRVHAGEPRRRPRAGPVETTAPVVRRGRLRAASLVVPTRVQPCDSWGPSAAAATWRSTSAPRTRSCSSAAAGSCSSSHRWSRSRRKPAGCTPSAPRRAG